MRGRRLLLIAEAVLILTAVAAALLIIGFVWQKARERSDSRRYPLPGCLITSGDARIHVNCKGQGRPPVILEAGIAASSTGWAPVHRQLADLTRVCAYDRPGLGWSPLSKHPKTPDQYLLDLRSVVQHAGPPIILVGHSFGALLVRLYASHYPEEVRGVVLADSALLLEWADPTPDYRRKLARGVGLSRRGALLAKIGFVRLSLTLLAGGSRKLPKLFARMSSGRGVSVTERLVGEVRKLPPELWPVIQSHWCRTASFQSMADHLESLPAVAAAVQAARFPPNMPLTVISGSHLKPSELLEHQELAASTPFGKHIVAEGSGHWVHLDRPDVIVQAVTEMLNN